jgi:nucleotide-binding universal stress UspA family protein
MTEVILVVLRRPEAAAGLLTAATQLAALAPVAMVNVLAVRQTIVPSALGAEALMFEADDFTTKEEAEAARMSTLQAAYTAWRDGTGAAGLAAHWAEAEGSPGAVIGELGSRADLVVCARPTESDRLVRQDFSAALFGTDRPVLVLPPVETAPIGRRVAIAWRDEKRAMRAVIPALRWLAQAEETHLLIGLRGEAEPPPLPPIFVEHGIRPQLHVLRIGAGPFGRTLLDQAHALGADLLVMGAYAHSPLRELILGGVTRYMLQHADLPILMRH